MLGPPPSVHFFEDPLPPPSSTKVLFECPQIENIILENVESKWAKDWSFKIYYIFILS